MTKTTENLDDFIMFRRDNFIFLAPKANRSIKIIYEDENPCPIAHKINLSIRCKHAKIKHNDNEIIIYCEESCDCKIKKMIEEEE